jgi:hypothetical protein
LCSPQRVVKGHGGVRYLYLVHRREDGADPAQVLGMDIPRFVNGLLRIAAVCLIVYWPPRWPPWSARGINRAWDLRKVR